MGAAKDFIGNAIQEIFVKKETDHKRMLPSIKNMKVVSVDCANSYEPFYDEFVSRLEEN